MIKDNVSCVRQRIASVCARLGVNPESVILVGITKNRALAQIQESLDAGINEIGESRVQEALLKYNAICDTCLPAGRARYAIGIKWHMVGHLQSNKVKEAVKIFDLIQSVDSPRLAIEINKEAAKINKIQDILIEVKTSPEATKFGIKPETAIEFIKEISGFKNINIRGLMTIAPLVDSPEEARLYFRQLRELRDKINAIPACRQAGRDTQYAIRILSMGMTDDFEIAIEEGSNMIRLGRAIFE